MTKDKQNVAQLCTRMVCVWSQCTMHYFFLTHSLCMSCGWLYYTTRKTAAVSVPTSFLVACDGYDVCDVTHLYLSVLVPMYSGLDPIAFGAICGVGTGAVGLLLGGAFYSKMWRVVNRKKSRQLDEVSWYLNKEVIIGSKSVICLDYCTSSKKIGTIDLEEIKFC